MYVDVHACVCACHKGRIERLRLSTCESVYMCICASHARTYNNGGLKVGWVVCMYNKPSYRHNA